ncbi:MAG: DUF760 domain-containing protein [Elainellaceae cyanobacterium]
MVFDSNSASFFEESDDENQANQLLQYMQHQPPEVLARVAKTVTADIKQIVSQNVQGLVGVLPNEAFNIQVTTDKENLASLLASAMMTGYFLRRMEQRMELEDGVTDAVRFSTREPSDAED